MKFGRVEFGAGRAVACNLQSLHVSGYDAQVAGGQGTLAVELLMQLPAGKLDAVFVPVGGGGLMAGVAAVLKARSSGTERTRVTLDSGPE